MGHGAAQIGPGTLRVVHGAAAEEELLTFVVLSALSRHYLPPSAYVDASETDWLQIIEEDNLHSDFQEIVLFV